MHDRQGFEDAKHYPPRWHSPLLHAFLEECLEINHSSYLLGDPA